MNNFIYLFEFVDDDFLFLNVNIENNNFFSRKFEPRLKNEYKIDFSFNLTENIISKSLMSYYDILKNNSVILEKILEWFFKIYLVKEFGIEGFSINLPTENLPYLERRFSMKKVILFFYLNCFTLAFSKTIEEIKNSYEYLLGESIWGMIIFFPFMFFIYRILYECYKICNKKIITSKEYKKIDYLKILNNIKLILIWCFLINITSITTRVTTIFPVWLILFFIYSFKEILNLFFKDIEKQKMDGFILFFFILVFCLSLGNLDLKNILGIIPITFL